MRRGANRGSQFRTSGLTSRQRANQAAKARRAVRSQSLAALRLLVISLVVQFGHVSAARGQGGLPSTSGRPPEAPAAAAAGGAQYLDVIDRAWRGVGLGLGAAVGYELFGRFQGRARDEHRRVLLALLRHLGDERFALAMGGQPPGAHASILRALRVAAGADSTALNAEYPLTFGPRAPGDPSVEQCAAITSKLVLTPDRRLAASPDNRQVVLPASAPPHVTVIVLVTASGRVDTSVSTVVSMPHADSATVGAIKRTLATWRFVPASLRGCALPAWKNLELEGAATPVSQGAAAGGRPDSTQGTLAPGLYVGPWDDEYSTHWLVLLVDAHGNVVTYNPPELLCVCDLRVIRDSIFLQTGRTADGLGFNLYVRGSLTASGFNGTARRVGRNVHQSGPVPIALTRYPIDITDKKTNAGLSGLYDSLRGVPETGDVLGDELLLVPTTDGLVALWTEYAGGPEGPYRADSVTVRNDSVRIVINAFGLFTQPPLRPLTRVFALRSGGPPGNGSVSAGLERRATLQQFLGPAQSGALPPPRCER